MAGYNGYSMSNNAVAAYHYGEKPKSKWSKSEILALLDENIRDEASKLTIRELRGCALYNSSWHHTSSYYNKTEFYSVDTDLSLDTIKNIIANRKPKEKVEPTEELWECEFLEWSGTRNYPKATKYIEIGKIKGNWFYREDGSKKSINAKGFRQLHRV